MGRQVRIAVLSDTHIPRRGKSIPETVLEGIQGVDLIIHAGDISRDYVLYELQELAPVEAVAGNTDDEYLWGMLSRKKLLTVEGKSIGIIHGDGSYGTTLQRVEKAFAADRPDCIVFGHSHQPFNQTINGILYFNPGSPTDKRMQERHSYGILTVGSEGIRGEIIFI